MLVPNFVLICPTGLWAYGWTITPIFLNLYLLLGNLPRGHTYRWCLCLMNQMIRTHKGMLFRGFIDIAGYGVKSPETPILGVWIGFFKPNTSTHQMLKDSYYQPNSGRLPGTLLWLSRYAPHHPKWWTAAVRMSTSSSNTRSKSVVKWYDCRYNINYRCKI